MERKSGGALDLAVDAIVGVATAGFVLGLGLTVRPAAPTALDALALAGLGAIAIAGWAFVRRNRPYLAGAAGCLLLVNAAWNPVLWLLIVPASAVLVLGAVTVAARQDGADGTADV